MIVTSIVPQVRTPERVNLFVDNQFACAVSQDLAKHYQLQIGQTISEEQLQALQEEDSYEKGLSLSLNYLTYRPRSRAETKQYLARKHFSSESIDRILNKLEDMQLLDDQKFAEFWLQVRMHGKPKGRRGLTFELRQKGLARPIIETALSDVDDIELALKAARSKAVSLFRLPDLTLDVFQSRIGQFLQRRGFDYPIIRKVVSMLWQEYLSSDEGE